MYFIFAAFLMAVTQSCSNDVGGNEDGTKPVVTINAIIDANDTDGETIGTATIQWSTNEPNKSTVDIHLSTDSGVTFDIVVVLNAPDNGEYIWDTNTVADCLTCRIRITPTDVVGNVGDPTDSAADFIINNVPQVSGSAFYFKGAFGTDSDFACFDTLVVPFDKNIDIRTPIARDFQLPVFGDSVGQDATVALGQNSNELIITFDEGTCSGIDSFRLHLAGTFASSFTALTSASGIDVSPDIPVGTIVATDTGRDAQPSVSGGIDIAPTFYEATGVAITASNTVGLALGYLDNNATLDAVVIDNNSAGFQSVYSNSGLGNFGAFAAGTQALGDANNTSVVVGDLDGVNGPDIIVGNTAANLIHFNNNNDGDFVTLAPAPLGSSNTQAVALGDIDNDGDLDLITGNTVANRVWRNNGSGSFSEDMPTAQTLGTFDTRAVVLGDIDGDGDLDLVTGNGTSQANKVYLNDGVNTGNFTDTGQSLGSSDTFSIALTDVDGDGDLDIYTGNNGQPNKVWLNDGAGTFTDSGQTLGNENTRVVAAGDYDGDGDIDLVSGDFNTPMLVWLNDGAGVFTTNLMLGGSTNISTQSLAMADIDSDGDLDLLEGLSNVAARLWKNSASFAITFVDSDQSHGGNNTFGIALGDVDGDGDSDMVSTNRNQENRVFINDIDSTGNKGVFTDSGELLGNFSSRSITLGDIDLDGDLDIITGNDGGQGNRIWLNNTVNNIITFDEATLPLGTSDTFAVALGDIDDDGDLDLVTGNDGQVNKVWINNGPDAGVGTFTDTGQIAGFINNTTSIVLGDIDGDTDLDLVTGNDGQGNRVFENTGIHSGMFVDDTQSLGTNNTRSLALGDIDGDGDLDLVTGNSTNQGNRVYINNGVNSGTFVDSNQSLGAQDTRAIKLIDIDNDGDLDIVTGNNPLHNQIYLNRGDGVFSNGMLIGDVTDPTAMNNTNALDTADVDGDGDIDFVSGNGTPDGNRVWLNDN